METYGPMADEILETREGTTLLVTLNRPEQRNALTFTMYERLAEIARSAPKDDSLRAIVITGAGGKAFGAGTDISLFRQFKGAEDGLAYEERISRIMGDLEACQLPVIAAISGACTGGGAAIAACCDIRLGTKDMRFGFPIARTLGNCLSTGSISKMSSLLGPARVIDLIFTARLMEADECLRVGLVNEIHDDHAAVLARARAMATDIAGLAPITLRTTKEALRRIRMGGNVDDKDLVAMAYGSEDFREGLESFLSKRKPQWKGR